MATSPSTESSNTMTTATNARIRKVTVIYNPRSGTLLAAGDNDPEASLRKLFVDRGVEAELHTFDIKTLSDIINRAEANSVDALIVCGGDGSILAVVAALGERKLALGLIPGGTMNVLARDIGLPIELEAAADVIVGGQLKAIDVGYVNGAPFLCNSEIGMMPHMARIREKLRELPWWKQWPRVIVHALVLMRTYPRLHLMIEADDQTYRLRTRAVVISNNLLSDTQGPIPPRASLTGGTLGIYIAHDFSRWTLLRIAARMMAGTWQSDAALKVITTRAAVLSLDRPRLLSVMNDGEPTQLQMPLNYSISPGALRVLVPAKPHD